MPPLWTLFRLISANQSSGHDWWVMTCVPDMGDDMRPRHGWWQASQTWVMTGVPDMGDDRRPRHGWWQASQTRHGWWQASRTWVMTGVPDTGLGWGEPTTKYVLEYLSHMSCIYTRSPKISIINQFWRFDTDHEILFNLIWNLEFREKN